MVEVWVLYVYTRPKIKGLSNYFIQFCTDIITSLQLYQCWCNSSLRITGTHNVRRHQTLSSTHEEMTFHKYLSNPIYVWSYMYSSLYTEIYLHCDHFKLLWILGILKEYDLRITPSVIKRFGNLSYDYLWYLYIHLLYVFYLSMYPALWIYNDLTSVTRTGMIVTDGLCYLAHSVWFAWGLFNVPVIFYW